MGIAKAQFDKVLNGIFTKGNKIELFSTMPNPSTESGYVKVTGTGYTPWMIGDGDFTVGSGSVQSAKNMLFYLCETTSGHGTAVGFGVFDSSNAMLYFGEFDTPMTIGYNTVPTIKKYNGAGEGIRITMTSTEASAASE